MKSGRILVVDADTHSRQCLRSILTASGYEVQEADSPDHGLKCLSRGGADLVILEANLAAKTVRTRAWRKIAPKTQVALIAFGTRNSEQEEIAALDAGVDDYLKKPFSAARLLARIAAVLRRIPKSTGTTEKAVVQLEDRQIDLGTRRISSNGCQIRLTPKECELLQYFFANANIPISYAELLEAVWGPQHSTEAGYIRVFVRQLRRKLEPDPSNPRYLLTEPWVGYKFAMPVSRDSAQG
ncbi:MAG: response regulator transcription factor [Acidobacteriia bacterium]|nr:response regulator transcription factor [Terriglobia bacterium]